MTREEAIKTLKGDAWLSCPAKWNEAFEMAISVLSENEGDLISRTEVINAIDEREDVNGNVNAEDIRTDICLIPSNSDKGEWIPVSERLPKMGVRVLCACQADLYDVLKLTPDGWFYDTRHTYMFGFVKAWQPLPEPYKAESEVKPNEMQ